MEKQQFLVLVDELLELEPGTLKGTDLLEAHGWDSLAVVGFIALADEQFGVSIAAGKLAKCKTSDDLLDLLEGKVLA